jgi:hypothetical protein
MDQMKGVIWRGRACDLKMVTATHWLFVETVTWPKDLMMYSWFLRQVQHEESVENIAHTFSHILDKLICVPEKQ